MSQLHRNSVDSWEDFDITGVNPMGPAEPQTDPNRITNGIDLSGLRNIPQATVVNGATESYTYKCQRCLRALWATHYTEDSLNVQEAILKLTLREMIIYIFFLILVCIVGFGMASVNLYYFSEATYSTFVNTRWDPYDSSSTFENINNVDEWYKYALGPLLSGLYMNESSNNNHSFMNDIQLIGVPRLRLLRVRNNSCTVNPDFIELVSTCFAVYSSDAEDQEPYGPQNGTAWFYTPPNYLDRSGTYNGELATYNSGGYIQDLYLNLNASRDVIISLQKNTWIDELATRVIFIEFSQYNINVDLFCIVKLVCEFSAAGGFIFSSKKKKVPTATLR